MASPGADAGAYINRYSFWFGSSSTPNYICITQFAKKPNLEKLYSETLENVEPQDANLRSVEHTIVHNLLGFVREKAI